MGGESTTRTAPRSGGTGTAANGGRLGQRLSGVAVALGLVLFLGGFGWAALSYRPYTVPTSSMTPTIDAGNRVLAQRVDGDEVRRGDVVVFRDSSWVTGSDVVKRVVAVGGDTVSCCTDGKLTVNGKQIEEPYLPKGTLAENQNFATVTVPRAGSSCSVTNARAPWTPPPTSPTPPRAPSPAPRWSPGGRRRLPVEGRAEAPHRIRGAGHPLAAGTAGHHRAADRRRRRPGPRRRRLRPIAKRAGRSRARAARAEAAGVR